MGELAEYCNKNYKIAPVLEMKNPLSFSINLKWVTPSESAK